MPKLNDHGIGVGGKMLGIPIFPLTQSPALRSTNEHGDVRVLSPIDISEPPIDIGVYVRSTIVDGDIYIFGGKSTDSTTCYKYNPLTKGYTRLADKSTNTIRWMTSVGTDIYYGEGTNGVCKYDTLTDTHSQIAQTPYNHNDTVAETDGKDIYLFGAYDSSVSKKIYKLQIKDLTFTYLYDMPKNLYKHQVQYVDGDFYIFGGFSTMYNTYKYDLTNNTHVELAMIPFAFSGCVSVKIKNAVYLISGQNSAQVKFMYEYDIVKNVYTRVQDVIHRHDAGIAEAIGDDMYMIGGTGEYRGAEAYHVSQYQQSPLLIKNLVKGADVHTDGDVFKDYTLGTIEGIVSLDDGVQLDKNRGTVRIPIDGKYALWNCSYITIGG